MTGMVFVPGTGAAAAGAGVEESGVRTGSSKSSNWDSLGNSIDRRSSRILARCPSQSSSLTGAGVVCCCGATACSLAVVVGGNSWCVGPVVTLMFAFWPEEITRSTRTKLVAETEIVGLMSGKSKGKSEKKGDNE